MRRGTAGLGLWVLAAVLFATPAAAQFRVRAYVEPSDGIIDGRTIRLIVHVEGENSPTVTPPRLPELTNLEVVGGPSTSLNSYWANGRASAEYKLTYTLMPLASGPAEIPAMQLEVNSKRYTTEPIRFQVAKSTGRPGAAGAAAGGPAGSTSDPVFLEAELGTEEVWVGQPVPLTLTLFTIPRATSFHLRREPNFANFWVETLQTDPDAEAYRVRVGGQAYNAYPVDRRLLIPPSPGHFELEPYIGQIQVRVSPDRRSSWFSFGRTETLIRKSEGLRLHVRQLPAEGKPDEFSGAVGSYRVRASLDREQSRINDAVALKATVEGQGSLRSVAAPELLGSDALKVFDPQVKESTVRAQDGKVLSRKTWEWIIVPLTPGELTLPELRFSYFDPGEAAYRTAMAGELVLAVERGDGSLGEPVTRGEVRLQRRDLAFIKPLRGELREAFPRAHERGLFTALLVVPLGLAPLFIVAGRRRARLARDQGLARSRRARARARKRLQSARKQLEQADPATFHEQVARTLVEYVADRFDRAPSGLTYDLAEELLSSKGVDPALRRRFRSCLETCDFARFVPATAQAERRAEVLTDADELVEQLERAW